MILILLRLLPIPKISYRYFLIFSIFSRLLRNSMLLECGIAAMASADDSAPPAASDEQQVQHEAGDGHREWCSCTSESDATSLGRF